MLETNYSDLLDYTILFFIVTSIKGIASTIHRVKLNRQPISTYESESTLSSVMKIQMQFNYLLLHLTLVFSQPEGDYNQVRLVKILVWISLGFNALVLILTDYRGLLKIYKYENALLRDNYPVIEFLGIQSKNFCFFIKKIVFMMFGCALLIAAQWFIIPIISDLMYIVLCLYMIPLIYKSQQNDQRPNISFYTFIDDYCILFLYLYYRGYDQNIFRFKPNYGICITIITFTIIQQIILLIQLFRPQIIRQHSQIEDDIKSKHIYKISEQQEECSVCLQASQKVGQLNIQQQETFVSTICGHNYHEKCLIAWLKVKKTCPLCRTIIYQ